MLDVWQAAKNKWSGISVSTPLTVQGLAKENEVINVAVYYSQWAKNIMLDVGWVAKNK